MVSVALASVGPNLPTKAPPNRVYHCRSHQNPVPILIRERPTVQPTQNNIYNLKLKKKKTDILE